jgi:hypothetical protein
MPSRGVAAVAAPPNASRLSAPRRDASISDSDDMEVGDGGTMHRSQLSLKKRAEYFRPSTFEAVVALETAP